jgi:hypothetical protein
MKPVKALIFLLVLLIALPSSGNESTVNLQINEYNTKLGEEALLFVENKGQLFDSEGNPRPDVLFSSKSGGAKVFITANAIHYQFGHHIVDFCEEQIYTSVERFSIELVGVNPPSQVLTSEPQLYTENYYNEHFPEGLHSVRSFKEIILKDIYPGIDWVIYSKGKFMEYDFIVHPGADPSQIRFNVIGTEEVALTEQGALLLKACYGEVFKHAPVSFVGEEEVASCFELLEDGSIGYALADYPADQTLRIDPFLEWGTYYGGVYEEIGEAVATDIEGNVYLAGSTKSNNGIAAGDGIYDNSYSSINGNASYDAFLVKFNSAGQRIWCTYYGGTANDMVVSVAVDSNGVYLVGTTVITTSTIASMTSNTSAEHFPGSIGIGENEGSQLGTVRNPQFAKLGNLPFGSVLVNGETNQMATFVARFNQEDGYRTWGHLYGTTRKPGALTNGSYKSSEPAGIAIDGTSGQIWLVQNMYFEFSPGKEALETIFTILGIIPGMPPAAKMVIKVADIAFRNFVKAGETSCFSVVTLDQNTGHLAGSNPNFHRVICSQTSSRNPLIATAIASGKQGRDVYITAYTADDRLQNNLGESLVPLKPNPENNFRDRDHSQAVVYHIKDTSTSQFWPDTRSFETSHRFFGTEGVSEIPTSIVVDNLDNNHVYVGGTTSGAIPLQNSWDNTYNGGSADGFIAKFDMGSGNLIWSTYLGGSGEDIVQSLSMSPDRSLYATGTTTSSTGFATAAGGFSGGDRDAFLSKFSFDGQRNWSTFIGGSGYDYGASVATHGNSIYVSGFTGSTSGITAGNGFKVDYDNGAQEAFVVKYTNPAPGDGGIIYVKQGGTGGGSSWANATGDLHGAIIAAGVKQVWVAEGTYQRPSGLSFTLRDDVKIFGGFPATGEPGFEDRDWVAHETILWGNQASVFRITDDIGLFDFTARIDGFTIKNGISADGGGGIRSEGSSFNNMKRFVIANCKFENNTATSASLWGGGAICNIFSVPQINNCTFTTNSAFASGGAIANYDWSSVRISGCSFSSNTVTYNGTNDDYGGGGAIYNSNVSFPVIGGSSFTGNQAVFGGAIYNSDFGAIISSTPISNCSFTSNAASVDGGAIYAKAQGFLLLSACTFKGNSSGRNGGAIFNSTSGFDNQSNNVYSKFYNCLIAGNTAQLSGGGIYTGGLEASNLTIADNRGGVAGFGLYVSNFGFHMTNSIIWGNGVNISSNQSGSSAPVITHSLIQDGYAGTGNIASNPLFIFPRPFNTGPHVDGNYRLKACSPAIDAGNNSAMPVGFATDVFGEPRVRSGTIDMGAIESQIQNFSADSNGIIYIRPSASGNGSSWENATGDLSSVLISAQCDTSFKEIWVARGIYFPTISPIDSILGQPAGRDNAFLLSRNIKLYGGFNGSETNLNQRNFGLNETRLSGDLGTRGDDTDDAYHVVVVAGGGIFNSNTILDGFTIASGNANGSGSAIINGHAVSRLDGGGLSIVIGSPRISNCKFLGNQAVNGGAVCNRSAASPLFANNLFAGNAATTGGAMASFGSTNVAIRQSTFGGNKATAQNNAALYYDASSNVNMRNSVVSGNSGGIESPPFTFNVAFNQIQGRSADGFGNLNGSLDPKFTQSPDFNTAPFLVADYTPLVGSSLVNEGRDLDIPSFIDKDLAGNQRVALGRVDIGAYELQVGPDTSGVLYVRKGITGNGSSWQSPLPELADALVAAKRDTSVKEIWVAQGTYRPLYSPADNNFGVDAQADNTFLLVDKVKVYGGFNGTETALTQRNPAQNITILNGDRLGSGNDNDKVRHVVTAVGTASSQVSDSTVLDGFTIINGWANTVSPGVIVNETMLLNSEGAGIYNIHSNAQFSNLQIRSNSAVLGGGIANKGSGSPTFRNVLISGNRALTHGGACFNQQVTPAFTNVTISGNTSNGAGAMRSINSQIIFKNTLVQGNRLPAWSDQNSSRQYFNCYAEGATSADTSGNLEAISSLPIFLNPVAFSSAPTTIGDYRLSVLSPAIDAGNNDFISVDTFDLSGQPRIVNGKIDIGAYEFFSATDPNGIIYVKEGATGDGSSWGNALGGLQVALNTSGVQQVWVAVGTYKPSLVYRNQGGSERDKAFQVKANIQVYGGFEGVETSLSQRDLSSNSSTLSGDLGAPGNSADNSYHVLILENAGSLITLDGFIVTSGNADGNGNRSKGGGILMQGGSSAVLRNLQIINNISTEGGGLYADMAGLKMSYTVISGNSANLGGGVYLNNTVGQPEFNNVLMSGNLGSSQGGGMFMNQSAPILTNVTISGNQSGGAGAIRSINSNAVFRNTLVAGNRMPAWSEQNSTREFFFSMAENATTEDANGNLLADAAEDLFINPLTFAEAPTTMGDYRLSAASRALDAGNNDFADGWLEDLAGNPRITFGTVDMGAYEYFAQPDSLGIVYVKPDGTGDGSSWEHALGSVQAAINTNGVQQVWVATGTYFPTSMYGTSGSVRDRAIQLKSGVKVYGGFSGSETSLTQRNVSANLTVLSGDLGQPNDASDNAFHVVVADGALLDNQSILDGFTISDGNANGADERSRGGGLLIKGGAAPLLENLTVINNTSNQGAGAYITQSNPRVVNSVFRGNTAVSGGGIFNHATTEQPTFANTLISGNVGTTEGGALVNDASSPIFTNITIAGNKSGSGGAARNINAQPVLRNSIAIGNSLPAWSNQNSTWQFFNSMAQEATTQDANGNLSPVGDSLTFASPLSFSSAPSIGGDFNLSGQSPAINAGNNSFIAGQATDLAGNARIVSSAVDLGAYEYFVSPNANGIIYVKEYGTGNGSSWEEAMGSLQGAIFTTGVQQVWVAAGTYKPTAIVGNGNSNRDKSFQLRQGVKIYGGFAGHETNLADRDWNANESILSGDLGVIGDPSDNAYSVVYSFATLNSSTELDGFTITGGNANLGTARNSGGGIYLTGNSAPLLRNLRIVHNYADLGGGLAIAGPSPQIANTVIASNTSTFGGGVYLNFNSTPPQFTNVLISGNRANVQGGGVYSVGANSVFTNTTIAGNTTTVPTGIGGGIHHIISTTSNNPVLVNSIIWGNSSATGSVGLTGNGNPNVSYSLIQGLAGGTNGNLNGNLSYDNLFINPLSAAEAPTSAGDYRLKDKSPALDIGLSNAPGLSGIATDLAGNSRIAACAVDLGAFEREAAMTHIPDPNFEAYLEANGLGDGVQGNGKVFTCKIKPVTMLNIPALNIGSLDGVEDFSALQFLFCHNNQLTSLDLSQNTALQAVICFNNKLLKLNVKNGNNQNIWNFNALSNPELTCIEVDDADAFYLAFWAKPETTGWGTSCCSEPEMLQSEVLNSNAVRVNWVSNGLSSRISYRAIGATPWRNVSINSTIQTRVIQSLEPATTYEWRVTTFCNAERTISSTSIIDTFTTLSINICAAAEALSSSVLNSNAAQVSWAGTALLYRVFFRPVGTARWSSVVANNGATSVVIRNLQADLTYEWRVVAYCSADRSVVSEDSPIETFTTLADNSCASPLSLSTTAINSNVVELSWVGIGLSYTVFHRVSGTNAWRSAVVRTPQTTFVLRNLQADTEYDWKVVAFCDEARTLSSDDSPESTFTTLASNLCPKPFSLSALVLNSNAVRLTWFNFGAVSGTVYYRIVGANRWQVARTNASSANSLVINTLIADTTYEWKVVIFCNAEGTLYSEESDISTFQTAQTNSCPSPTELAAQLFNSNAVQLSWDGSGISYTVRLRPLGTSAWRTVRINNANTQVTVQALLSDTEYEWTVVANCEDAFGFVFPSEESIFATFLTPGINICPAPTELSSQVTNSNAAQVSWQGAGMSYRVFFRPIGTTSWRSVNANNAATSASIGSLIPNTTYEWKVQAFCSMDRTIASDDSEVQWFTTLNANICPSPTQLSSNVLNNDAVNLSWQGSGFSYTILYRAQGNTAWASFPVRSNATTAALTGLNTATTYEWKVVSFCDESRTVASEESVVETFTTFTFNTCNAPFWLSSTVFNSNAVEIEWTGFGSSFTVFYRPLGATTWLRRVFTNPFTGTTGMTEAITGLLPATTYQWKVVAHCNEERTLNSADSPIQTFLTWNDNICASPSNLSANVVNSNAVELSWTGVGLTYSIALRPVGTVRWRNININSTVSSTVVGALLPSTEYEWRILGHCSSDKLVYSDYSDTYTFVTPSENNCETPIPLDASILNSNAVQLYWAGVGVSYMVSLRPVGTTRWRNINVNNNSGTTIVTALLANTEYEWKLKTFCTEDRSIVSEESELGIFTTNATNSCAQSINLEASVLDSQTVLLNWVGNALSYHVLYRVAGATRWLRRVVNNGATSTTVANLQKASVYEWRIVAFCNTDRTYYSDSTATEMFYLPGFDDCLTPTELSSNFGFIEIDEGLSLVENFSWIGNGVYYIFYIRPIDSETWEEYVIPEASISLQLADGLYEWKIVAVCSADGTILSNESEINIHEAGFIMGREVEDNSNFNQEASNSFSVQSFTLYPNPARDRVTVNMQIGGDGDIALRLFGADGKVYFERIISTSTGVMQEDIDVSKFPQGMYFIQMMAENGDLKTLPLVVH